MLVRSPAISLKEKYVTAICSHRIVCARVCVCVCVCVNACSHNKIDHAFKSTSANKTRKSDKNNFAPLCRLRVRNTEVRVVIVMILVLFIAVRLSELRTFAFDDKGLRVLPQPRSVL